MQPRKFLSLKYLFYTTIQYCTSAIHENFFLKEKSLNLEIFRLYQGRRKQLESGEAKHGVISISIQEVLCSYLIVAELRQLMLGGLGACPPEKF